MDEQCGTSDGSSGSSAQAPRTAADNRFDRSNLQHLVANLHDSVVEFRLAEQVPIVVAVNPAFEDTFGYKAAEICGESLNEYIVPDRYSEEATGFDRQSASGESNRAIVRRRAATGVRSFLYRSIPYSGSDGSRRGYAIYTDITREVQRKRRLEVLHRLLRHNLRNDLTVIDGNAQLVEPSVSGDERRRVSEIRDRVSHLEHLTREATELQRLLDTDLDADRAVNVADLCRAIGDEYRTRYPDASITVDAPDAATALATNQVRSAVTNLVENAVEHNSGDHPTVRIRVSETDEVASWVEVHVEDDGPLVPDIVADTVTSPRTMDQLQHTVGLGLWIVRWLVTRCGGEIAFRTSSDLGGNHVVVRLPRRD